jgi:hypothetical protein
MRNKARVSWLDLAQVPGIKLGVTLRRLLGIGGMKTFLKILLLVVVALVAIKLLPIALVAGCVAAALVAVLAILGVSLAAAVVVAALVVAAVLSPIWLPVLVIVGVIALCKRLSRPAATPQG